MSAAASMSAWLIRPFEGFDNACRVHADATALEIGDRRWSYGDLQTWSLRLAALLAQRLGPAPQGHRVGLLASGSLTAYGGSLAVLGCGAVRVALDPAHPVEHTAAVIELAGIDILVAGDEALSLLPRLMAVCTRRLTLIAPESVWNPQPGTPSGDDKTGADSRQMATPGAWLPPATPAEGDLAGIVFTGGGGTPCGLALNHRNLATYLRNVRSVAPALPGDRVATTCEASDPTALTDMLNTWWSGATLVVVPARALLAPARFILDHDISVWGSTACVAVQMHEQGQLRPGAFPLLRQTLLSGEALPMACAEAWSDAAPGGELFHVYGPAQATLPLAFYRWQRQQSAQQCRHGLAPIGVPFAGHHHLLLNDDGCEIKEAGQGELYVQGPQVGPGYWQDAARTADRFVTLPGHEGRWFKTGDLIERDTLGLYHLVGRSDSMDKVHGASAAVLTTVLSSEV